VKLDHYETFCASSLGPTLQRADETQEVAYSEALALHRIATEFFDLARRRDEGAISPEEDERRKELGRNLPQGVVGCITGHVEFGAETPDVLDPPAPTRGLRRDQTSRPLSRRPRRPFCGLV